MQNNPRETHQTRRLTHTHARRHTCDKTHKRMLRRSMSDNIGICFLFDTFWII